MKRCPKCDTTKSADEFAKSKSRADGLQSLCKECKRALDRARYKAKPETYRARNDALRKKITSIVREAKDVPCADCKQRFHYCAMDFDHLPGTDKLFNVSLAVNKASSIPVLLREIEKCEVVCSNCHRLRSWNRVYGV